MWTPRRILLLLAGLVAFGGLYAGYARILGTVDGLPTLPARFRLAADGEAPPPVDIISPTDARLIEAFGPNCPEKNYSAYPTKIEMREDGIVFAAGRPQWDKEPSRFVTLAPFSVATFGKPRTAAERLAGEVTEINTIHADKAVLEFDKVIGNERDMMGGKAKLIGVELRSEPTPYSTDARTGRVVITSNQRSADANKALTFKTPGPVFYRVPDAPGSSPAAPHIWTTAAVQIENRENMPRPLRAAGLTAVPTGDEGVGPGVVAGMLLGTHTPPHTIAAEGMKIYLKPATATPANAAALPGAKKAKGPAFAGVRVIELSENVLMNLWVDGKSGFPGSSAATEKPAEKKPASDPPAAAGAVLGGFADAGVLAARLNEKALVRIRTLGPFRYDYDTTAARFEVSPRPNPLVPNNVEVHRHSAAGGKDYLVCQLLELEFDTPPAKGGAAEKAAIPAGNGFKAIRATGTHVYLSSATDGLEAQGTALVYSTGATPDKGKAWRYTQTILQGAPLVALRQKNKLEAGRPGAPGQLVMTSFEPPPELKQAKRQQTVVRGPGRVELFDAATNATTLRAIWSESLDHSKDIVAGKERDLFAFAGDARFEDPKGDFDLSADTLRLWLDGAGGATSQPVPYRLQGVGRVRGKSADAVIRDTDTLNVWFEERLPPAVVKPVVAAGKALPVPVNVPPALPSAQQEKTSAGLRPPLAAAAPQPAPAKSPPMHLSARAVEAWVVRYPNATPAKPGEKPTAAVSYQLDRVECQDRVVVHQDPADPAKSPRGTDVTAAVLHLTRHPAGHSMIAVGTDALLAEVHFENMSLAGPRVLIDQPNNACKVTGRGWLKMPSGSDLGGAGLAKPADLTVAWAEKMTFLGERRTAEFVGQVQAEQRGQDPGDANNPATVTRSYTICHRMDVTFDRPVYFNQLKPSEPAKAKTDAAKIEYVVCAPAPEDGDGGKPRAAAPVVFAEEVFAAATGKPVKANRITAKLLELKAEATRTLMTAAGPGESRALALGQKDAAAPTAEADPAKRSAQKPGDQEMKLTVVRFAGKLRVTDQKGIFQKAVFEDAVRAFHLPSENLDERVEDHAAPPRAVVLRCTDTLTVSSYKGQGGAEGRRDMEAVGDARVRDDSYLGVGHVVTYDGAMMTLRGYGDGQATLHRRQRTFDGQDYKSGKEIRYDTRTGRVTAVESSGGSFTTGK